MTCLFHVISIYFQVVPEVAVVPEAEAPPGDQVMWSLLAFLLMDPHAAVNWQKQTREVTKKSYALKNILDNFLIVDFQVGETLSIQFKYCLFLHAKII